MTQLHSTLHTFPRLPSLTSRLAPHFKDRLRPALPPCLWEEFRVQTCHQSTLTISLAFRRIGLNPMPLRRIRKSKIMLVKEINDKPWQP